ncbi:SOS response-associated peptidase [bacterium]|nr:MAG: SOS response-associated peptidase [bacterium]
MCGRFILLTDLSVIVESFGIVEMACQYRMSNNISPGQQIATVIHDDKTRLVNTRWGLIPSWAKDPSIGNRMFNARAETIAEKPSFKKAFQTRRCLIPADGFYEWQKLGKVKKPFYFSIKSGQPFGFAGLYETWMSPERIPINTCTIITTQPNELVRSIHDRMPVIVPKDKEKSWIDPVNYNQEMLLSLLKPYPPDEMLMLEVDEKTLYVPKAPTRMLFGSGAIR